MCIIIHAETYYTAYQVLNDRSLLWQCWQENPHGAGIAWRDESGLHVQKGFMTFPRLMQCIDEIYARIPSEISIHFRIATHGGISRSLTHPFPTRWGLIFHNGVFSIPRKNIRPGESDTSAVTRIVSRLSFHDGLFLLDAIRGASRVLVMSKSRGSFRLGQWEEYRPGLYLSHPIENEQAVHF